MMNFTLEGVQPFDILIARIEFEDKPGVSKPRPVIVIDVSESRVSVTAVKVTSHAPREGCPGEVFLSGWSSEGLSKPSVARCSKVLHLQPCSIKSRIGSLTGEDAAAVVSGLLEAGAM